MSNVVCPSCGLENPATNTFCAKCATSLSKLQARENRKSRIFLPPQSNLSPKPLGKASSPAGLIIILLLGLAVAWSIIYYYR